MDHADLSTVDAEFLDDHAPLYRLLRPGAEAFNGQILKPASGITLPHADGSRAATCGG
jgi:hypothetical protein